MVSSPILLLLGAATAWAAYNVASGLRSNIAKARKTNLPYIAVRKSYPPRRGKRMHQETEELTDAQSQRYTHTIYYGSSHPSFGCPCSACFQNRGGITRYCKP